MITNIRLSNFRAFQSEVNVRIRPITVLIGRNSAGKTSLIKFLLMLRQTLESQSDQFFVTDGPHAQLGTWRDLRHSNSFAPGQRDSACRFDVTVRTSELPPPEVRALWEATSRASVVRAEGDHFRINVEIAKEPVRAQMEEAQFDIAGAVPYGRAFQHGAHAVYGRMGDTPIFKQRVDTLARIGFLRFSARTDSLNKLFEGIGAEQFLEPLRQEFLRFRHLSPVREESGSVVQTGSPPPRDVGQRGQFAMPHLARILSDPEERPTADFITSFAQSVAAVDHLTVVRRASSLLRKISGRNPQTGAVSALGDFGFGVSQCLPIFVQGAMHHERQLLIVEQPEAQLHPTAQLEMGSFFADLWNLRKVPCLIETHSGNILLRLRKLISKGELRPEEVSVAYFTLGERSSPSRRKDDEVWESLGRPSDGRFPAVVVKNLDLNPDGSIGSKEEGLPMEFFGADLKEALDFGREEND